MRSRPAASARARISALARSDKWFLGGLDGVVWAPPFPRWLDRPGFWDPVHMLQHEVGPGFSVALVRPDGRENPLRAATGGPGGRELTPRRWRPGRLDATWSDERGVLVKERRQVLPGGILESSWQVPRGLEGGLVGFTAQPADTTDGLASTARRRWLDAGRRRPARAGTGSAHGTRGLRCAGVEEHRGLRGAWRTRMAAFALCGRKWLGGPWDRRCRVRHRAGNGGLRPCLRCRPRRRRETRGLRCSVRCGLGRGCAPLRVDLDRRRPPAGGNR